MILGGGQCQKCKCIPCDPCEQECTEPHTGDAYEVVYTLYQLGVETGNTTDGYLTASGSRDEDDPYDGMDGSSPWYQQIEGGFSFGPSVTRNPCTVRVSFWRSTRTLGPTVFPPPAATLTVSKVTVSCTAGKVRFGENIISEGESQDFNVTFPLVTGSGDQSENDPRTAVGTFAVSPLCREASFSITARIEWTTSKRLHTLYGLVRECYEEGTPCDTFCDGDPAPDVLYLTISNAATTIGTFDGTFPNGTYVLDRVPGLCAAYLANLDGCTQGGGEASVNWELFEHVVFRQPITATFLGASVCGNFTFDALDTDLHPPCGPGVIASGSIEWGWYPPGTESGVPAAVGTIDWEVEV